MAEFKAIVGAPGTGKTSTISERVARHVAESKTIFGTTNRNPVAIVSLTKAAALEAAGRTRLPKSHAGTLHSMAFHWLGCPNVATGDSLSDFNERHKEFALSGAKKNVDSPFNSGDSRTRGDAAMEFYALHRTRMDERKAWGRDVLAFAERWEAWKKDTGLIDFCDMIELAAVNGMPSPGTHLYIDEAQDFGELELSLLRSMVKACDSATLVGDDLQCIYRWRGANPTVIGSDKIKPENREVLGQSYRVPKAVHAAAVKLISAASNYKHFPYSPREFDGSLAATRGSYRSPECFLRLIESGKSTMFLGTCDYHLGPLVKMLRSRGIPFSNPWRPENGYWNPLGGKRGVCMADRLAAFLRPDSASYGDAKRPWTWKEMHQWLDPISSEAVLVRGAKEYLASMDKAYSEATPSDEELAGLFNPSVAAGFDVLLGDMWDGQPGATQAACRWWRDRLLGTKRKTAQYPIDVVRANGIRAIQDPPKVHVGTIHSVKGAEADQVVIFPDLSPKGQTQWKRPGPDRDDVLRVFYVALTRAREAVFLAEPASRDYVPLGKLCRA